jgi:hypothetical protein
LIDGEPITRTPVSFDAKMLGHSIAADVRPSVVLGLFTGACGHTYGHHSVWQMWSPGKAPINNPLDAAVVGARPIRAQAAGLGAGCNKPRWLLESSGLFLTRVRG